MSHELDGIFRPKSIAVVGASTREGTIGHSILHNLIESHFNGPVFPVNPKASVIHSIKCFPTVTDIPDPVDMAIIIVQSKYVMDAVRQCGEKGVKGVVVITSGFKEVGEEGAKLELELLDLVRSYNMRMIGPNCFGVLNTESDISMNGTFSKVKPMKGNVGFMSQSGALGEAIIGHAQELNLGFSMFASVGNKADISGNALLEYWQDDPQTEIILLYLESFGAPRKFTKIARDLSRKKPIIAVKAGRTSAGARAVSSHTGVLAGLDVGVDALFGQCGVLRVSSIDEMFDLAVAFANQPIPRGDRVAVITNAGGPGILATDALANLGLQMAKFDKKTTDFLRENLPLVASVNNPIDVIAAGGPDSYRKAIEAVLSDDNVDSVIVIFVPPIVVDHRAVIQAIVDGIDNHEQKKTVLGCFMASKGEIAGSEVMTKHKIPIYTFPESAAKAMAGMVRYRKWLERPEGEVQTFDVDRATAEKIVTDAASTGQQAIIGEAALDILEAYGIAVAHSVQAKTVYEVMEGAEKLGYPVIMKIDDPKIVHKSDVGGVTADLRNSEEVRQAFEMMKSKFSTDGEEFSGVIIQELVQGGIETIIGMNMDPSFGPLMMFGLGGVYVEVMKDVTFKVHPVTSDDAREMIESIKGYPLLTGFRGAPAVDIGTLSETIQRLSQLANDFPQIDSFDVNPFIVTADRKTSKAVDARFMLK